MSTTRTLEQEIEHLRAALALAKAELTRLTRENMDLAAMVHHAGLDGEPMPPLAPPAEPKPTLEIMEFRPTPWVHPGPRLY